MAVVFYPQYSVARRFRYPSENIRGTFSYLHKNKSEFRLDNLENHQNWQLNLLAINYDNEDSHEGVKLHYCRNNIFNNPDNENDNTIIIKTNQIKFDFIQIAVINQSKSRKPKEIEKIKKSKLEGKQKENLRILAILQNTETSQYLKVISKIIRNKGPGVKDDLNYFSKGMPQSSSNWEKLSISYKNYLLYYPEEMTLRINERIIKCSTEISSSTQYNLYEFLIPEEILGRKEELNCVIECSSFQKSATFPHTFFEVDRKKRKSCENVVMSHQVHNTVDASDEPVNKKPLLQIKNSDLCMTPEVETTSDMNFRNISFDFNSKIEIFNLQLESERSPAVESKNIVVDLKFKLLVQNPDLYMTAEVETASIGDFRNLELVRSPGVESDNSSNQSFSRNGFLDDFLSPEETDKLLSTCNPDLFLELNDINDILNERYPL